MVNPKGDRLLSQREIEDSVNEISNDDAQAFFRGEKRKGMKGFEERIRTKFPNAAAQRGILIKKVNNYSQWNLEMFGAGARTLSLPSHCPHVKLSMWLLICCRYSLQRHLLAILLS